MKLNIFLSALLVLSGRHCSGASIADELTVEEWERAEISPSEEQAEAFEAIQPESVAVPSELINVEAEEPKAVEEDLVNEGAPLNVEELPREVVPVGEEENCESPRGVIDEVSADRAERQANVDLLKALDTVLAHKETLDDVMRSEGAVF